MPFSNSAQKVSSNLIVNHAQYVKHFVIFHENIDEKLFHVFIMDDHRSVAEKLKKTVDLEKCIICQEVVPTRKVRIIIVTLAQYYERYLHFECQVL